ncbi:MAG TPA: hypothetical protein VGD40_17705 [Chryseosolibacter sp.]
MNSRLLTTLVILLPFASVAQEEAMTSTGRVVILYPDSTWKLKPAVPDVVSVDSATHAQDTIVAAPKVEVPKQFSESSTGFKGFQKPPLKLANLPEMSDGVYQFKVKVNKEGIVKEVVTLQRGPNGEAEIMMRNAITRLKFLWDNSIVPPLTEGVIKITVPAVK